MDPFFIAFGIAVIAIVFVLIDIKNTESKEKTKVNTERYENLEKAHTTSATDNRSFLLNIINIDHQTTRIVGVKNHDLNEIEFSCKGKPDHWQIIPIKEGFKEEPHENVQIIFKTIEKSNSEYEDGVGELWIQRRLGESLLNLDIEISHNTARHLSRLKSFDAQFCVADKSKRVTSGGEAYEVEYFVIEGLSENFTTKNSDENP